MIRKLPIIWVLILFGILVWPLGISVQALPFKSEINQGNNYYHKGDYEKAQQKYLQAFEKKRQPIALFNLGDALYKQGKYDESLKAFALLTAETVAKTLRAGSLYNLGNNYFRQENFAEAIKSYEEALKLQPKDEDAKYNLEIAKIMLKMPKKPKQNQQPKQKQEKNKKPERKKSDQQPSPANNNGMSKEDAERILQGLSNDEKHKARRLKAGQGKSDRDW